jgi:single-stranded-DNA-specific exonuclease
MIARRWIFPTIDPRERSTLASLLSISPIMASVLLSRGIASKAEAQQWLSVDEALYDPLLLPDIEPAIDRLHRAVIAGESICFYGDYDVDGMAATSLYVIFFRRLGANARWYVPHRIHEGYGLHEAALKRLASEGVTLLVTSDCGTTAHREVTEAARAGLDVIITDHHQGEAAMPPALAILNPHRPDSHYPFKGLCSAGLAFKVVQAYSRKYAPQSADPESLLDLVALATIADVVPLQAENRSFVRTGLARMSQTARCGIQALKQAAGIDGGCTSGTVAFRLAPRLNAAGRLAHADLGVRLLTTECEAEAFEIAQRLEALNTERQGIEERTSTEAAAFVGGAELPPAIVVSSRGWHLGVVGIVAARLVERYHRPAIVIAMNDAGVGKGSARSVPGVDLYQALARCADSLQGFGGHPSAAGLTVLESRLTEFINRFNEIVAAWTRDHPVAPLLHVDAEVKLMEVRPQVIRELDRLHPHGAGNPEPLLASREMFVLDAKVIGEGHLKVVVRQQGSIPFEAIGFRMSALVTEHRLALNRPIDLAFTPELNRWNGLDRMQLRIADIRSHGDS